MIERLSTRSRLFLFVLAAGLPLIVLSVLIALGQRAAAESRARAEIQHHAQLIATMLNGARLEHLPLPNVLELGPGEEAAIIDDNATILAMYPPNPGRRNDMLSGPLLESIVKGGGPVIEQRDAAGRVRLYVLRTAVMDLDSAFNVSVIVSVPKSVMYEGANRALVESLSGIAALTLLLMVFAWYGAERLVLRPIRRMLDVTARVRAGDLSARTGMTRTHQELAQLGAALDETIEQLQTRDSRVRDMLAQFREQAVTDELTRLYNRRYFWDALTRELIAVQRKASVFCVILIDLDHFKDVNDTYGHDAGDLVLQTVADVLRASVRGSDIAVRYGGEEFALLLPDTTARVAEMRAETLRRQLAAQTMRYGPNTIRVTASFGVVELGSDTTNPSELMRRVDAALYAAKEAGRNRVFVYKLRGADQLVGARRNPAWQVS